MTIAAALKDDLALELVDTHLQRMLERGQARRVAAPLSAPVELHLELTHRCNLKCVMCEHWEIEHNDPDSVRREMDFEKIRALVDGSRTLRDIRSIAITGGEPWLRTDFVDIVCFLSERFPQASIVVLSNFWNTGHIRVKLEEFRARGVKNLRLGSSLDGMGATHDKVRGQIGAFEGLSKTASMLKEFFPEYSYGFTFTMTPHNAHELLEVYRHVVEVLGCGLGAQWVIDRPGVEPLRWTPEQKDEALRQVRAVRAVIAARHGAAEKILSQERGAHKWLWSELLYWKYLEDYGREPKRFDFFRDCEAGERHVMLDPEGEMFFCPVNRDRTLGNAAQGGIDSLWNSERAEEEREYSRSGKCHCWLRCTSVPVLDRIVDAGAEA